MPALPASARQRAADIIAAYAALPPDPYGTVYGHFDAHGWNMAFDHSAGRLNGIYDFADSGIGPLHRDFICSAFISWDLTQRLLAAYEAQTDRALDRQRVHTLIGYHRLWELAAAVQAGGEVDEMVQAAQDWLDRH